MPTPQGGVGATSAWLRLEPGNLKTFPHPLRPMRVAVSGPQKEAFRIEEDGKVRSVSITTAILALSVTVSGPRACTRG